VNFVVESASVIDAIEAAVVFACFAGDANATKALGLSSAVADSLATTFLSSLIAALSASPAFSQVQAQAVPSPSVSPPPIAGSSVPGSPAYSPAQVFGIVAAVLVLALGASFSSVMLFRKHCRASSPSLTTTAESASVQVPSVMASEQGSGLSGEAGEGLSVAVASESALIVAYSAPATPSSTLDVDAVCLARDEEDGSMLEEREAPATSVDAATPHAPGPRTGGQRSSAVTKKFGLGQQ